MKRLLIILALLCLPTFSETIQACQCREYGTPICAQFWRSDAVFVGQVTAIAPLKNRPDREYDYVDVSFRVEEQFKGVSQKTIRIATATTMCDTTFKRGRRYLVYASLFSGTNQLFTGMCVGTTSDPEDEDLNELRKLSRRETGESISGRITKDRYDGVPGIPIEITGGNRTYRTMTKKQGEFSVSVPGPGTFKVRVLVPYVVTLVGVSNFEPPVNSIETNSGSTFGYDLTLKRSECKYLELDLFGKDPRKTATLIGKVVAANGASLAQESISLIHVADTGPNYDKTLSADGSFAFERVAPGEYYLVINALDGFYSPYARTYYPATRDKLEAKKIVVTERSVIENLELRLGPPRLGRTVMGTVAWKNGRRPEDAYISVYLGEKSVWDVRVDNNGTYNFTLYGDGDYSIAALVDLDGIKGRSQRIPVPRSNFTAPRLVIQRVRK